MVALQNKYSKNVLAKKAKDALSKSIKKEYDSLKIIIYLVNALLSLSRYMV